MTKRITNIFLAILLISTVIGGGVYLSLGKKLPALLPKTQPAQKLVEIQVASWKTYQNKDFSFKYPSDWKIATQEGKIPLGTLQTEIISSIVTPTVTPNSSGAASMIRPPEGGSITIQTTGIASQSAQQFPSSVFTPATKLKLGKTKIQAYVLKQHGALINYLVIPYEVGKTQYALSFDYYNYQHPDWDYLALFDEIINSFRFTLEK